MSEQPLRRMSLIRAQVTNLSELLAFALRADNEVRDLGGKTEDAPVFLHAGYQFAKARYFSLARRGDELTIEVE